MTVGILALQGAFREHEEMFARLSVATKQVRLPSDLEGIDRLVIPGGESTVIGKLLDIYGLIQPIRERVLGGMPLWGTCAGAILVAKEIAEGRKDGQATLELMDITARRNAFGRQKDSFEIPLVIKNIPGLPFPIVCIRAPLLENPGDDVEILARLPVGGIIAAQQNQILATCFHPELTDDTRMHEYFLSL